MEVLQIFGDIFGWLTSFSILGIPYLYIVVGILLIGMIIRFIKGEK